MALAEDDSLITVPVEPMAEGNRACCSRVCSIIIITSSILQQHGVEGSKRRSLLEQSDKHCTESLSAATSTACIAGGVGESTCHWHLYMSNCCERCTPATDMLPQSCCHACAAIKMATVGFLFKLHVISICMHAPS